VAAAWVAVVAGALLVAFAVLAAMGVALAACAAPAVVVMAPEAVRSSASSSSSPQLPSAVPAFHGREWLEVPPVVLYPSPRRGQPLRLLIPSQVVPDFR
jgi:hypothetical protein